MNARTTTPKSLSKAEEIALIEKLAEGNGYFADGITAGDITTMIVNIKNDFPILIGTSWCKSADLLDEATAELQKFVKKDNENDKETALLKAEILSLKTKINNILVAMVKGWMEESPVQFAYQFFRTEEVVKAKLENGVALDSDEAQWILDNLKK
jgi:hypothetical protein